VKINLIQIGKTRPAYLEEGIREYEKRIGRYAQFGCRTIPNIKSRLPSEELKIKEGELIIQSLKPTDMLILLDEGGKQMDSRTLAKWMDAKAQMAPIHFAIGGAHGFSEELRRRAYASISLSSMTFSHQLVRLIFMEQLYRALTILNGHPYHND
jgi:23S rRNA (pseudouridine1915-N3)-methyltransferase